MFFIASRIFWFFFSPANLLVFLAFAGVVMLFTRFARKGRMLLCGVLTVCILCGFGPLGTLLIRPLENRFPPPPVSLPSPDGIIILGGAIKARMTALRGVLSLPEIGGGRILQAAVLAHRYTSALVVYSGGPEDPSGAQSDEAHAAWRFLISLGVAPARIALETRSRNTGQNATFSRELLHPATGQKWLLVTSAAHMPRAVGAFRRAGFDVVAYPTDYRTLGNFSDYWGFQSDPVNGLITLDVAVHEWLGLIAYRLTGRADTFLPGP